MPIAGGLDTALALEFGALEGFRIEIISSFGSALSGVACGVLSYQADCRHDVTLDIVDGLHSLPIVVFGHVLGLVWESTIGSDVPGKVLVVVGVG